MQLINTVNSDMFRKSYTTDEKLDEVLDKIDTEEIKFSQWKRINVEKDGKTTKKIKLIDTIQSPAEFATNFKAEFHLFCEHAARAKEQYEQIKQLKIKMPSSHVIAQLDFAQNYSCQALEEVQSAYWDNSEQVTLHPVVFYYKSNDGSQQIQHKSCIIISDCMVHNASNVAAFIKVKEICPDVNFLHYWSDSPTSQCRNKTIFSVIAHHKKLFGMSATWNYFEAGHGKGPCDGVGGTSKRMADQATKRNIRIQSAGDFYAWASSMESLVEYKFVGKEYREKIADELKQQTLKPIPGTMKLHSVVGNGDGVVHVRQLSCFCIECYDGNNFEFGCSRWTRHDHFSTDSQVSEATASTSQQLSKATKKPGQDPPMSPEAPARNEKEEQGISLVIPEVNDYVATVYSGDGKWYIGMVIEVDDDDEEANISFMVQQDTENQFKWPTWQDIVWTPFVNKLCKISCPIATGRSKRLYNVNRQTIDFIGDMFAAFHSGK